MNGYIGKYTIYISNLYYHSYHLVDFLVRNSFIEMINGCKKVGVPLTPGWTRGQHEISRNILTEGTRDPTEVSRIPSLFVCLFVFMALPISFLYTINNKHIRCHFFGRLKLGHLFKHLV